MRRFLFKLERLLEIRKFREHEWELKLAEITGRCVRIEQLIRELSDEKMRIFLDRGTEAFKDLNRLALASLYMQRLSVKINDEKIKLEEEELKRRGVQEGYMEASRARKSLDKLKEKRGAEYYREQEAADIKAVDEINTATFIRNRKYSDAVGKEGKV
ncbi:MAG: flagellar export protein FliJ [Spirochaetales bacterium]|nr:MAG: flagellar export protein FliJ [Spirochaetales bacterium]